MHFDLDVISKALQTILEATLPVLTAMAVAWLNAKYQQERAKLNENQLGMLDDFIRVAVFAAEQMGMSELAESKLDYVTNLAQSYIDRTGLVVSAEELRARIEAAVKDNFPKLPE